MSHEALIESSWQFSEVSEELDMHRKFSVISKEIIQKQDKTIKQLVHLVRAKNEMIAKLKSTPNHQ
jgi:hypothetical protein